MRHLYLIARREYLSYVATPGFWATLAFVPFFMVLGMALPLVMEGTTPTRYFTVIDASYQQWYDGKGTTSGVNFYITLISKKKLKDVKFDNAIVNGKTLTAVSTKGNKRFSRFYEILKGDTIRIGSPLVLKGLKPDVKDTTTLILNYEKKEKSYQIPVTGFKQKQKIYYP